MTRVNCKIFLPIQENPSKMESFLNEFFYYGEHRYKVIKKAKPNLKVGESREPRSVTKTLLKVGLLFTVITPLIAGIYKILQIIKWSTYKNISVIPLTKPSASVDGKVSQQGKRLSLESHKSPETNSNDKQKSVTPNTTLLNTETTSTDQLLVEPLQPKANPVTETTSIEPTDDQQQPVIEGALKIKKVRIEDFEDPVKALNEGRAINRFEDQIKMDEFLKQNGSQITCFTMEAHGFDKSFIFDESLTWKYLKYCPNITTLKLPGNSLTLKGIEELAQIPLEKLEKLSLTGCNFTPIFSAEHLEKLLLAGFIKNLKSLCLSTLKIKNRGIELLNKAENLQNLKDLNLWGCDIQNEMIDEMIKSKNMQNLHKLQIGGNLNITDESAQRLRDNLKNLTDKAIR